MNKKAAFAMAFFVAILGVMSAIYLASNDSPPTNQAEHMSHNHGEIQAPPQPPRMKPLERVIATPK